MSAAGGAVIYGDGAIRRSLRLELGGRGEDDVISACAQVAASCIEVFAQIAATEDFKTRRRAQISAGGELGEGFSWVHEPECVVLIGGNTLHQKPVVGTGPGLAVGGACQRVLPATGRVLAITAT